MKALNHDEISAFSGVGDEGMFYYVARVSDVEYVD